MSRRRNHMGNWTGPVLVPTFKQHVSKTSIATEALLALDFGQLCNVVEIHVEVRPDVDVQQLERLSNALGLQAHMEGRNA